MKTSAHLICFAFLFVSRCVAQNPDNAGLRGVVTDATGAFVAGAAIDIRDTGHQIVRSLMTGPYGNFTAEGLTAGVPFEVTAAATGFATAQSRTFVLASGTTATLQLHLVVAGSRAMVEVTGAVDSVRADEPQLGDRLTAMQMKGTPLLNRRITYLPLLNAANRPAINQGDIFMNQNLFTANGTGRRQTWFAVDGASGNDAWGRQTIFTNVPLDAVSEMTVLENAFAAQYGFAQGAVVNIVTRSGGDNYHGNVLGLWRPSAPEAKLAGFTAANATSGNDLTRDTLAQGAATLGGPIPRSPRSYFAGSAEYSYQDRASPVTSPIAPGNYIGHYRDWLGSLRLDHSFSDRNRTFFRGCLDDYFDTNPNGSSAATRSRVSQGSSIAEPIARKLERPQ